MILQTYIPESSLNQFVDRFIYFEGFDQPHSIDRFLPDGNVEIVIDLNDAPQYIYDNETLEEIQACRRVWASGVRTGPITIPAGKNSSMLIIAFRKGMAYPFFPVPMNELSDSVLDADLLWGDAFALVREQFLAARGPNFQIIEDFLNDKFRSNFVTNPCVQYAANEIIRRPDEICLRRLYEKIGYSQKHFISMFKTHVGITPKSYLKIMRFQKAVSEIEIREEPDWPRISQDCGFYDQAHFINDFKRFSGFTPGEYAAKKNSLLNYVPVG